MSHQSTADAYIPQPMTTDGGKPLGKGEKACVHCGARLPRSGFPVNARTRDGRSSWCRPCHREAAARHHLEHYVPHPRPVSPIPGVSLARLRRLEDGSLAVLCSCCGASLPAEAFGKPSGGIPGLRSWCLECSRDMATIYNRLAGHPPRVSRGKRCRRFESVQAPERTRCPWCRRSCAGVVWDVAADAWLCAACAYGRPRLARRRIGRRFAASLDWRARRMVPSVPGWHRSREDAPVSKKSRKPKSAEGLARHREGAA
jgi:hypothetical protein